MLPAATEIYGLYFYNIFFFGQRESLVKINADLRKPRPGWKMAFQEMFLMHGFIIQNKSGDLICSEKQARFD